MLPEKKDNQKYRFRHVMQALALAARAHGVRDLAYHLNVKEGHLRSKLTLSPSPHAVNIDEFVGIVLLTGDLTPLRKVADLLDHIVIPRGGQEGAEACQAVEKCRISAETSLDAVKSVLGRLVDGHIDQTERQELLEVLKRDNQSTAEAIAALQALGGDR